MEIRWHIVVISLSGILFACPLASRGVGQERTGARDAAARRLIAALEERGMPDMTLMVLDRIERADAGISPALSEELPYRRALALVAISRREGDLSRRLRVLESAQDAIDEVLNHEPPPQEPPADEIADIEAAMKAVDSGIRRLDAMIQKGNVLIERARLTMHQAARDDGDGPASRAATLALVSESIATFRVAEGMITSVSGRRESPRATASGSGDSSPDDPVGMKAALEENSLLGSVKALLARIDVAIAEPRAPGRRVERNRAEMMRRLRACRADANEKGIQLGNTLRQVRLLLGTAWYEKAKSIEVGSNAWRQALHESIATLEAMYEQDRSLLGGQYARLYQGRSEVAMALGTPPEANDGDGERTKAFQKAIATLRDVRSLPPGGPNDDLRARAYNLSLECWLATLREDQYATFDGLDADAVRLALTSVPQERLDSEWLGLKYRTALILSRMNVAAKANGVSRVPVVGDLEGTVQRLALTVTRANREFAPEARELLSAPEDLQADESFTAVIERGMAAFQAMKAKQAAADGLTATGDGSAAEAARAEVSEIRRSTIAAVRRAMKLAGDGDSEAIQRARFLLTFLLYEDGRFADAAAMGEFLVRWYPELPSSRRAARVAMAAWQQFARTSSDEIARDARRRGAEIAGRILDAWPDDPAAIDAVTIAAAAAAEAADPQRIVDLIGKIPTAAGSGEPLLRTGIALWQAIVARRSLEQTDRPTDEQASSWRRIAAGILDEGLAGSATQAGASTLMLAAALARCHVAMDEDDFAGAQAVLERTPHGPWTLLNASDDTAGIVPDAMAEDILRMAVRVFVQSDQIAKAEQAMAKLERMMGDSTRLSAIYLEMGRELERQLDDIVEDASIGTLNAEQQKRASALLSGFERFLAAVAVRDRTQSSQSWVASTYRELGSSGLPQGGASGLGLIAAPSKAGHYLSQAATAYESLLTNSDRRDLEPSIRLKLVEIYRATGHWDEAIAHMDWILGDSARVAWMDAQVEAARLLQQAGEAAAESTVARRLLSEAIVGRKEGSARYWGWGGIAGKLSRQAAPREDADDDSRRARDLFFEARLNLARCRVRMAERDSGEREALLRSAEQDVIVTYRFFPDLGGDVSRARFDALLKEIQQAMGLPQSGFATIGAG